MFGVHAFAVPYFGQGPGGIVVFYGPVSEEAEGIAHTISQASGSTGGVDGGAGSAQVVQAEGSRE